jgi:hypothetical protein
MFLCIRSYRATQQNLDVSINSNLARLIFLDSSNIECSDHKK